MKRKIIGAVRIAVLLIIVVTASALIFYNKQLTDMDFPNKILRPMGNSFSIMSMLKSRHTPKKVIYGYLPYWSIPDSQYIQLDKLTDIAYFGVYLNEDGTFMEKLEDGTTEPGYLAWRENDNLDELISRAKSVGVRVSLTVISHNDEVSDKFLDCQECWATFINNVTTEMDSKKIRDLNLNFEYVELTDKETAAKYTEFVKFTNTELDKKYGQSLVVVSTFADSLVRDRVTDINSLGSIADMIFIMGYDFHRPDSDKAGPVAPIDGIGVYAEYDIRTMLNDYVAVMPPSKIILGVPYYGYNWVVKEGEPNAERIPGSDDTGYSQSQIYAKIMDTILEIKPEVKWDELGKVPYFTYTSPETGSIREVYFENAQSLGVKYQLINEYNLGGVGMWALGYDGGYQELWELLEKFFIK
jgi:spore germination protein